MHIKYSLWLCWKVIRLTCFIWFDSSTPSREKRFRWEKSGKPPAFPGSCSRSAIVVGRCCHLKYLPHVHLALHPLSLPWPLTSDRWKRMQKAGFDGAAIGGVLIDQTATGRTPGGSIEIYCRVVSVVFRFLFSFCRCCFICQWPAIRQLFNLQREFPSGTSDLPTDPAR